MTKSVTVEPRGGNPAPRVAEYPGGMLNSVGLANPGWRAVRDEKLPWMRRHLGGLPVFVSVAGALAAEYGKVIAGLDAEDGFVGFELNLSCPNDSHLGGKPFCLDPEALREVLGLVRPLTERPLIVKLAPNDPDIAATASLAVEHGADGVTAINTVPGFLAGGDGASRLGAGRGGTSGPALLPVGLAAVCEVAAAVDVPVMGVGGILTADDARAYFENVQQADTEYTSFLRPQDEPAIWLNAEIMQRFKPQLEQYYYDPSRCDTYLEQLGIEYPTIRESE